MDFLKLAQSRRSIRSYMQKKVSKELILKLIQAAQSAPSGGNCQPWHFYIITDEKIKEEIVEKSCRQSWMSSAPVFIVVCDDIKRSEKRYGDRGVNLYSIQDTAAAIQNILLCASDLGLGTCWCGAFDENELSLILGINDNNDMRPVAIIPVGYAANEPAATKRRPIEEIATFIGEDANADIEMDEEIKTRKFEHCDMGETEFNDVNLGSSIFTNINFHGVDISDANLSEGKIHDCNLSNLKIYNCKLNGMTINGKAVE